VGIGIWFFFVDNTEIDSITKFGLVPGGSGNVALNIELPTLAILFMLTTTCIILGVDQLARGFGKYTNWILALVITFFVFGFLTWGAADKSLNLGGLLGAALVRSVPIVLGAFAGILSERAGVVNIAIEGMMLTAAMVAALVGSLTNLWIGLLAAIATGALLALIHGILSIRYKTNQIISGTVINIFAVGFTSYISARFLQKYETLNNPGTFTNWRIPILADIPVIGPLVFNNNLFVYAMLILVFVIHFALFYTRWGLRTRAVGEHPKAADTLGINVFRTRYVAVILGGMMAGFAGAYFTLGSVPRFDENLTAGRGFIALAAVIFGDWKPFGAMGAGLLFGFTDSLQTKLAILGLNIPSEFLLAIPYLVTMFAVAGLVGRGHMPAADGQPYDKE
jgi:simple sugar transport system permease protein